jgi:hypothetical protein
MRTHTTFFSFVFVVFLFTCLLEVGCDVSMVSAIEVGPRVPDLNGDGVVNFLDLTMWARSWNSHPGNPNWNSAADLNYDDVVDVRDAVIILKDFGKNSRFYDFNDLSGWNVSDGSWSVQNGILEGSSSQHGLIYVGDAAWKDCTFTAKLKIAEDSEYTEAAVAFFVDPNNFYWAGLGCWGHRVSISARVSGVWRELAFSGDVADVERDVWYVLTVEVSGGTIMLYVDGSLELSINDSTFVSGSVGIRVWDSHVIVDYVTAIGTKVSQGQPVLMGIDDVSSFAHSTVGDWTKISTQINILQQYGGNIIDILIINSELTYDTPIGTYKDVLQKLRSDIRQRGMLFGLQPWGLDDYDPLDHSQNGWKVQVVNNVNGLGDRWINEYANIVALLQPDLINIFSEPATDLVNGASSTFMQKYIDFCCRAIDAWRTIKPDLTVAVMGLPFWDLKPLINAGGIPRSNVLYALHYYYQYEGNYPPDYQPEMQAYWNGDLANAKTLLYEQFLEREGIQSALDHNFKVWFEALGCNINNPNALVFCKDAVDFCNQYKIGYGTSGSHPYNGWSWMFNSDGTLNACGRILLERMRG